MANHMSHHMDIEPDDEKTPRSSPIKSSDISTIPAGQGVHMAREDWKNKIHVPGAI